MTLVVTINTPESIWLLADRRLTYKGRPPKDDAHKVMVLEATDGVALLGYAGLGATALGNEPADWMSSVLRGRNLPLEQSLGAIADAMKKHFPPHLLCLPRNGGAAHNVLVPALLNDEPRFYTIDLVFAPDRKTYQFRYTRHVSEKPPPTAPKTPPLAIGGSGALYLMQNKRWMRNLLRAVRANDRGKLSSSAVADQLANLNYEVHMGIADKSVGPSCIVVWRHRKGGFHEMGGGQQFYTGTNRDANSPIIPHISNGTDMQAFFELLMPHFIESLEGLQEGQPPKEFDKDKINSELAILPDKPDEILR